MKKYVVGYEYNGKFVVLHESDNVCTAMIMVKKFQTVKKEEIKIKKRLDK